MLFLQAKLRLIKHFTIFDELDICDQNPFVDIILKRTITIKNYSK